MTIETFHSHKGGQGLEGERARERAREEEGEEEGGGEGAGEKQEHQRD